MSAIRTTSSHVRRSRIDCPCASDPRDRHSERHEVWCPAKLPGSRRVSEALIAALREAREIVEKWAIVRHHMGDNYARERLLMDRIDALLPPEPQR